VSDAEIRAVLTALNYEVDERSTPEELSDDRFNRVFRVACGLSSESLKNADSPPLLEKSRHFSRIFERDTGFEPATFSLGTAPTTFFSDDDPVNTRT